MKHQGIEGFTFDPPASEWDYWEASDKANASKLARGPNGRFVKRWSGEFCAPANQWSDPDPYRVISWRDYPPSGVNLWVPTLALILATVLVAWQAGYL